MSTTTNYILPLSSPPPLSPHVALLPSAGMGHLTPILLLAAMLASHNCHVTLITAQPPLSTAKSTHISTFLISHPTINTLNFHIIPYTPPDPTTTDPFFVQYEAMNRSVHLLSPLLSSTSPPLSTIISDIGACAGACHVADDLGLPHYILSTTSARFTSFVSHLPSLIQPHTTSINIAETRDQNQILIPGLAPFETSTIPPPFLIPNHIFTNTVVSSSLALRKAKGILINTFHAFEHETLEAVNGGKLNPDLPPFLPIGPLEPHGLEVADSRPLLWLDQQPPKSVVFVSFGNRTALLKEQITELGKGLEGSGYKFLWVLKSKIVDKEDIGEVEELVGDSFIQRTKDRGVVVKGWVDQEKILTHPSIGCFISHCGWNSVVEAVARGVPMLAWPQIGDQKVNAGVVETVGIGVWDKGWGWLGEKVVKGEEIAEKVTTVMTDSKLRENARKLREEAKGAVKVGGSCDKVLREIISNLQH
ncbi:UDP-glycosyltransferase 13-like [Bidens hawaiensis]|uniref:UDP-glycosyltransferase 13-like n=1 Tax=Bidens hawaiensis TaxID=980011 RepID=UPI00404A997E